MINSNALKFIELYLICENTLYENIFNWKSFKFCNNKLRKTFSKCFNLFIVDLILNQAHNV